MKSVILLFLDHKISKVKAQTVFYAEFDLDLFDFTTEFKKQIEFKDGLTSEINSFIENGEVIPIYLLEELIAKQLQSKISDNILMYGYPKSVEQYQSLEKLFGKLHIFNEAVWFVKQRDPELYLSSYYNDPKNRPWLEKYGLEVTDVWRKDFTKNRDGINSIMEISRNKSWHIVEIDYEPELTE